MAYFKITTNKKGVLSAKIQAYGIDFATKKRKVQYKRIVNDEGLSRAKFTKFVEREAIAFEESLAELYEKTIRITSCNLSFVFVCILRDYSPSCAKQRNEHSNCR